MCLGSKFLQGKIVSRKIFADIYNIAKGMTKIQAEKVKIVFILAQI